MPRRIGEEAQRAINRAREMRWQHLIRNHHFRAEVRELRKAYREDHEDAESRRRTLIGKWNLTEIPTDILREPVIPDDIPRKLEYYQKFLDRPPFGYPVEALSPLNDSSNRYLNLKVDLTEPVDLLLYFIAETLREHRQNIHGRRRLDKTDFQLKVFDLYEYKRKDFEEIARLLQHRTRTVKGRRNTVRSAYAAARLKIYGTATRLPDEMNNSHNYENCSICRKAKKTEEFCRIGREQLAS